MNGKVLHRKKIKPTPRKFATLRPASTLPNSEDFLHENLTFKGGKSGNDEHSCYIYVITMLPLIICMMPEANRYN
eukprot:snap_masked-scaffold_4-processed-gene-8.13-mRNA-1 protein AED:1.00 eAED:1.00 QI:0/0/0/0/1/1/2/0/74